MNRKAKRYLKDIILILLIVTNLILAMQIWLGSNPVANGNKNVLSVIIDPIQQFFSGNTDDASTENLNQLMRPQTIVLTQSTKRAVLYSSEDDFSKIQDLCDDFIRKFYLGELKTVAKESISDQDYYLALKDNSIYITYGNLYDFRLFSASVNADAKTEFNDLGVLKEYTISLSDNILNNITIYVKDYKTATAYRYIVEEDKTKFDRLLNDYFERNENQNTLNYSFELNFHKQESGAGTLTKLVFEPKILFHLAPVSTQILTPDSDWINGWSSLGSDRINDLLNTFQVNPMTMRKYTDLTNAKVFVENDATLTLYPNGILKYETIEGGVGIPIKNLTETNTDSFTGLVSSAVDFVIELNKTMPKNEINSMRICSDLLENSVTKTYELNFDLYANGLPVLQVDPETKENCHAIEMKIENGYIKYYRQFFHQYKFEETKETISPVIGAMDELVDRLNPQEESINVLNISRCYVDLGNGQALIPKWEVWVDGVDEIITVK